jgi:RND family efflux transporter MFP subunit
MKKHIKRIAAVVLALAVAAGACLFRDELALLLSQQSSEAEAQETKAEDRVPVVLTAAEQRHFEKRLRVQGTLEAAETALVSPVIPGPITAIFVDEGDTVTAGETDLFQIDRKNLEEAVVISRQDLAVARCGQEEAAANLDSNEAQFEKAEADYNRFRRLREKDAVTQDALEQQGTRYRMTKAGLDHAKTMVQLAAERVRQAEAALAIAEKNLRDSLVKAPINGVVAAKLKEKGEFGSAGHPVISIEDPGTLEFSAFLPAEYYGDVQPDQTALRLTVSGREGGRYKVSWKSPVIHPVLRAFEMKCVIHEPEPGMAPGAIAEAEITLETAEGPGVPAESIQIRNDKQVLFTVAEDKAVRHEVETGLESGGWIHILSSNLAPGNEVISMGQFLVEDGTPVTVQKNANGQGEGG